MNQLALFEESVKTASPCVVKHAGASPWQRYREKKAGRMDIKIGYLTAQIDEALFIPFQEWAEKTDDWRDRLAEAINGLAGS